MINSMIGRKTSINNPAVLLVINIAINAVIIEKIAIKVLLITVKKLLKVIVSFVTLETIEPAGV